MNIYELQEILKRTTRVLAGKNIPVHMEGFAPRVEYDGVTKKPTRVFIPVVPENTPPKLIDAIHGFIDHECSHIMFSDGEDITDPTKNKLWHYIHNCIEDPRVNKAMGNHFPGSKKNIKRGYDYIFKELKDEATGLSPYDKEFVDKQDLSTPEAKAKFQLQFSSLWFAGRMGCTLSREKFHELHLDMHYDDIIDKCNPDMLQLLDKVESAKDVRKLSDYWSEFFSEEVLDKMKPEKGEGEPSPTTEEGSEPFKSMEDQLAELIEHKLKECVIESKEYIYWTDRFDKKHNKHSILREVESSLSGPKLNVASFEERTKQTTNFLAKDLRRLLEERRRRYYIGGYKSGKLNSKSLFSVRLGNDRIFKKKNEVRDINACVSLLIDMSGSMHGTKVYTAMQSAYAFAMTLQQLKVPYEVYGFVTEDSNATMRNEFNKFIAKNPKVEPLVVNPSSPDRIYAFKEFDESFDIVSKTAMTGAANDGCRMMQNEDSKHVMLALQRLSVRPERVKALFVFSDGMPAYCFSDYKRAYDQLKFLADNAKSRYGVDIYSVGIQSNCVSKFYNAYKVVSDISELPSAMFDFLRKVFG